MRVAATDCDFVPLPSEDLCIRIGPFKHVAIASLDRRKIFAEPREIFALARAREIRENVIDAKKEPALGKIHEQGDEIVAPLLEMCVLALRDVVDADVDLGSAWHPAGELFTQEKIRQTAKFFRAFNRIVVGKSEEIHAAPVQRLVNVDRIAVTFTAKFGKERGSASTGEVRVNMHIASHDAKNESRWLRARDSGAKLLKTQALNRLDTRNTLLTKS
jgi:hypothetical protein